MPITFETDRDVLRPVTCVVTNKTLVSNVGTLTTSTPHGYAVGWMVSVTGVDPVFDGTYVLTAIPTTTTLSFTLFGDNVPSTVATGYVTSPAEAYLKYQGEASVVLDDLAANTNFYAEPWDYNTVRIIWSVTPDLHAKALQGLDYGLKPRIAITRSAFGHPETPIDGEKILDVEYTVGVSSPDTLGAVSVFETMPSDPGVAFDRHVLPGVQALYDRNLTSGRWYYYSFFVMVQPQDIFSSPLRWYKADDIQTMLPVNYDHASKLMDLIPPYYVNKDEEFTPGTGRDGVLKRLIDTMGFEADYTRTLAEGIEHIYDIDHTPIDLLYQLGESNMGIVRERALGCIRYRSMVAAINPLYDERGSAQGIQKLTVAATKYNCKVVEGVNDLCLPDDAEFLTGTGSWGDLTDNYTAFLSSHWGGSTFNPLKLTNTTDAGGPIIATLRQGAVLVEALSGAATNPLIMACGLGQGEVMNRLHEPEPMDFYPRLQGIRCDPGIIYSFSYFSRRISGSAAIPSAGIMWFDAPENNTPFNITTDYISLDETNDLVANDSTSPTMTRHSVQSTAPLSKLGRAHVYAVPFIRFANSSPRNVTACMFSVGLNSAAGVPIEADVYLTLGTAEKIGDPTIYLGDPA